MKTVLVGLSGGVDSSVCAYLLKKNGYRVIGVTLRLGQGEEAAEDAANVARHLEIPFHVVDYREQFRCKVIEYFIKEYTEGKTPNPCIRCNRYMKWEAMLQLADEMGAEYIATGHYARIDRLPNGRLAIRNSVTAGKDQTYALYLLTQEQLERTLMPIGEYTKEQIRELAKEARIPVADKPDSQEICFVPEDDYAAFIDANLPEDVSLTGNFVTREGRVLGPHKGITHYTKGQRRGLDLPMGERVFVTGICPDTKDVIIGKNEELFTTRVICEDVNYMGMEALEEPRRVWAKIRYNHKGEYCTIRQISESRIEAIFEAPVRAATPGQALCFYEGEYLLGGGTITEK